MAGLLLLPLFCRFPVKKGFVQIQFPQFAVRSRENFKNRLQTEAFFGAKIRNNGKMTAKTQRPRSFVAAIHDRGTEVEDLGYKVERDLRARSSVRGCVPP